MPTLNSDKLDRLKAFLVSDPDNPRLLSSVVDAALQCGEFEVALMHLDHALKLQPDDPQLSYQMAIALRHSDQPLAARQLLETLAENRIDHVVVLYELADVQLQLGDFNAAAQSASRVISTPGYAEHVPQVNLILVRALHHLGRLSEAIAHAEKLSAGDAQLAAALATLYLDDGQIEAARTLIAQTAGGPPSAEIESVGGFLALHDDNPVAAELRFNAALNLRPGDGRSLLGSGLLAAKRMDLAAAIIYLKQAVRAMPAHLGSLNTLAWMQLLSGDLEAAQVSLEAAMKIDRNFADTHGGLAVIAAMKGDASSARDMMRTALKLDRNSVTAGYAGMLLEHGVQNKAAIADAVTKFVAQQSEGAWRRYR